MYERGIRSTGNGVLAEGPRAVEAAYEARRQLERDLHDGAQQRLVLAVLTLRRAASEVRGTPAEPLLAEAAEQLQQGLAELRELVHGLHPAVLSERGLGPALEDLAARTPVPVDLCVTTERVPPVVEAAIYFTVAEALTNVAKHAGATRATVGVRVRDELLVAEIADDGVGGARTDAGSGLRGLAERLRELGGTLTVENGRGRGTVVRARAPLPATSPLG
jgi:signal transduction histidine kinase